MELGKSGEDYLETILILQRKKGYVRSVDVARYLNFSKPSVCHAVHVLQEKGYLEMSEDSMLVLTPDGQNLAEKVYERHEFFRNMLIASGVSPDTAEHDACEIEHVISEESFRKIQEYYKKNNPAHLAEIYRKRL